MDGRRAKSVLPDRWKGTPPQPAERAEKVIRAAMQERQRRQEAAREEAAREEAARQAAREEAAREEAAREEAARQAAAAKQAAVAKPIEEEGNQWKRLGIYYRKGVATYEIPGGDFLVYVWNPTEKGTYLYKGNPVAAKATTNDIVSYNGAEYIRLRSFSTMPYESELANVKNVAKKAGSTTRASVLIGENLVFKTASMNGIVGCLHEVSRSLRVISAGFPHATVFGMHEFGSTFYIVEEKLDIKTSNLFFNQLKETYGKIFRKNTIDRNEQRRLANYIKMFSDFTLKLQEFGIGGDFKLNNLSFRKGNSNELVATDLLMGMPTNAFIPMTYSFWVEAAANPEGGEALFLDPFFRLSYYAPQDGGSKRRAHKTRRHRHRKTKTRRSKI